MKIKDIVDTATHDRLFQIRMTQNEFLWVVPEMVAHEVARRLADEIVRRSGEEIMKIIEKRLIRQIKAFYGEGL